MRRIIYLLQRITQPNPVCFVWLMKILNSSKVNATEAITAFLMGILTVGFIVLYPMHGWIKWLTMGLGIYLFAIGGHHAWLWYKKPHVNSPSDIVGYVDLKPLIDRFLTFAVYMCTVTRGFWVLVSSVLIYSAAYDLVWYVIRHPNDFWPSDPYKPDPEQVAAVRQARKLIGAIVIFTFGIGGFIVSTATFFDPRYGSNPAYEGLILAMTMLVSALLVVVSSHALWGFYKNRKTLMPYQNVP